MIFWCGIIIHWSFVWNVYSSLICWIDLWFCWSRYWITGGIIVNFLIFNNYRIIRYIHFCLVSNFATIINDISIGLIVFCTIICCLVNSLASLDLNWNKLKFSNWTLLFFSPLWDTSHCFSTMYIINTLWLTAPFITTPTLIFLCGSIQRWSYSCQKWIIWSPTTDPLTLYLPHYHRF